MRKFAVILFAWYFIAGGGFQKVGVQFGPFKNELDCQEVAKQQANRMGGLTGITDGFVSKCWEG